jgi:ribokinase
MAESPRFFVVGNLVNAWFMHVDRLPCAGESLAAQRVFHEFGGKGLNLGYGLHRLGCQVDMLLALGHDDAGRVARQHLLDAGMNPGLFLNVAADTGFGVGFIAPDGGNFLAAHMGANALMCAEHVRAAHLTLRQARWALAHFEIDLAVVAETFRIAREAGVQTYLNPSPWRRIPDAILARTDILVMNETEACLFLGIADTPATPSGWRDRLSAPGVDEAFPGRLLVVTLADAGSIARDSDGQIHVEPAYPVTQIDATGAGDAFGCGLLHALSQGAGVSAALRYGNACGAIVAAHEGILAHLPDPAKVTALMQSGGALRAD